VFLVVVVVVCSAVLVIDNYIVRNLPQLSAEQIKAKYLPYFEDVSTYYETAFDIRINFDHVYVEATGSFTDAQDGGQLLDDFEAALQQGRFGNPTDACLYHLLTGRQPAGVGGLGWVRCSLLIYYLFNYILIYYLFI
jgi:hypothetical protein